MKAEFSSAKLVAHGRFESDNFWRDLYPFMLPEERFAAAKDEVARILELAPAANSRIGSWAADFGKNSYMAIFLAFPTTLTPRGWLLFAWR